jgi:pantothenate synthetase
MHRILNANENIKIDYASIALADNLSEPDIFYSGDKAVLLLAIYLGNTRLIDNLLITFP